MLAPEPAELLPSMMASLARPELVPDRAELAQIAAASLIRPVPVPGPAELVPSATAAPAGLVLVPRLAALVPIGAASLVPAGTGPPSLPSWGMRWRWWPPCREASAGRRTRRLTRAAPRAHGRVGA